MAGERPTSMEELLKVQTSAFNYAFGCLRPMSLMVAVQLGIPDAVNTHGGPVPLSALASAVGVPGAKVPALRRLMRALSLFGVFDRVSSAREEEEEDAYVRTAFSQQLAADSSTTAAPMVLFGMHQLLVTPWYSMADWLRGEAPEMASTGFEAAYGEHLGQSLGRMPEFRDLLNGAMASDARWAMSLVCRECPGVFRGLGSLVDVGGGNGVSAKAIKDAFPEMRCTVLELPYVVASLPAVEGVEFVGGDMFDHVPPADAVLLKWVLHDWDDDDCVRILRRCREAVLPARACGGKVIIIEMVVGGAGGDREAAEAQHLLDLNMLATTGGRERDEGEWQRIIAAAGFEGCKITPALGPRSVIEAYPAASA